MFLGYNTNGFAHHRIDDTLAILAEIGYQGVALTVDHGVLNPYNPEIRAETRRIRRLLEAAGMRSVVETGARYLLDPWRKHEPTLVSPAPAARARRVDFLRRCIDVAVDLGAAAVSFWSGTVHEPTDEQIVWRRLVDGCRAVADYAEQRGIGLGFEPEPGMFIDTQAKFDRLADAVASPVFRLTLDVGHVHCTEAEPAGEVITAASARLANVHIEDMRRGVHEHLDFGAGEIDFPAVLGALGAAGYTGGVYVELSRHSHVAVDAARRAHAFLLRAAEAAGVSVQGPPGTPMTRP